MDERSVEDDLDELELGGGVKCELGDSVFVFVIRGGVS